MTVSAEDVAKAQAVLDAARKEGDLDFLEEQAAKKPEGFNVDANVPGSAAAAAKATTEGGLAAQDAAAQAAALRAHTEEVAAVEAAKPKEPVLLELDRTKPYGTVGGEHELNAKYWQDGKYFDNRGVEIKETTNG
jgi:hypothetical protein